MGWDDRTPQERWLDDQRAADAADPWRDQTKTLIRDANGNLVQIPREPESLQRLSEDEYQRLTYPERIAYAKRFSGK